MAGLVPAIPLRHVADVRQFYVYILASRPGGTIYVGMTSNLVRRVYEHRNGSVAGFTKRYNVHQLKSARGIPAKSSGLSEAIAPALP